MSNILPYSTVILLRSKIFPSTFQHCTIIGAILQDLLFNFLPFYHRWCYAPRSSPRYGRHGWHMVCHMVSWGTIKSYLSNLQTWKKKTPFQQDRFVFKMPTLPQSAPSEWPQVAAPDTSQRVAASGRKWPLQPVPSDWPQVAASGGFLRFQFPPSKQHPWKIECRAGSLVPVRFFYFLSQVLCLARKRAARSYEVLHLSCKIISANVKIW